MKNKSINLVAFSVISLLWLGFLIVLFTNQQLLVSAWQVFAAWPLVFAAFYALSKFKDKHKDNEKTSAEKVGEDGKKA